MIDNHYKISIYISVHREIINWDLLSWCCDVHPLNANMIGWCVYSLGVNSLKTFSLLLSATFLKHLSFHCCAHFLRMKRRADVETDRATVSAGLCHNKRLKELSLLVLGQLWSNNWKLGALINPQLMGCAKCYRESYHTGDGSWGFLGSCPGRDSYLASICITACPHLNDGDWKDHFSPQQAQK